MKMSINQKLENLKGELAKKRRTLDMMEILKKGTPEEIGDIKSDIKLLEEEIVKAKGEKIPQAPPVEFVQNVIPIGKKIDILKSNIKIIVQKKCGINGKIKIILDKISSSSSEEEKEKFKEKLKEYDERVKQLESELAIEENKLKDLCDYQSALDKNYQKGIEIRERIQDLYYEWRKESELGNDSEKNGIEYEIRKENDSFDHLNEERKNLIENVNAVEVQVLEYNGRTKPKRKNHRFRKWFKRHIRFIAAISIMMVIIIGIVILLCLLFSSNEIVDVKSVNTVQTETISDTGVIPTISVKETSVQSPTITPTVVKEMTNKSDEYALVEYDSFVQDNSYSDSNYDSYSDGYSYSNYSENTKYNTYDDSKKDEMKSNKDTNKDEGTTGGNKGYGASTSNKKESPVPEKKFDEEHRLPSKVSQEEINNSPTVSLTPAVNN